jgi:hypothetical protein
MKKTYTMAVLVSVDPNVRFILNELTSTLVTHFKHLQALKYIKLSFLQIFI